MYLYVITMEDRHVSITASTRGFYLNQYVTCVPVFINCCSPNSCGTQIQNHCPVLIMTIWIASSSLQVHSLQLQPQACQSQLPKPFSSGASEPDQSHFQEELCFSAEETVTWMLFLRFSHYACICLYIGVFIVFPPLPLNKNLKWSRRTSVLNNLSRMYFTDVDILFAVFIWNIQMKEKTMLSKVNCTSHNVPLWSLSKTLKQCPEAPAGTDIHSLPSLQLDSTLGWACDGLREGGGCLYLKAWLWRTHPGTGSEMLGWSRVIWVGFYIEDLHLDQFTNKRFKNCKEVNMNCVKSRINGGLQDREQWV